MIPDKDLLCLSLQIRHMSICFSLFLLTYLPVRMCQERIVWRLSRHKTRLVIYILGYVIPS